MTDIKLGPSGSETTLPTLKFMGSPPSLSRTENRQIDIAEMSDRSKRVAFFGTDGEHPLVYGYLTLAELNIFKGLNALNQILRYQNNNVDATWYDVVIISFTWGPERADIQNLGRYRCRMVLKGV